MKKLFTDTEHALRTLEDTRFAEMMDDYMIMKEGAEEELLLPEEPDNGDTEYKFKFDAPNMARVEHLTT